MQTLLQDVRFGLRMMAKSPGFTFLVVLMLALGIGANSTIFSWINSTLLTPIPGVSHTSDMVAVIRGQISEINTPPFSYPDYADLRARTRSLSGMLAYSEGFASLTGTAKPERVYAASTSADYFQMLGLQPILGRFLLPGDEEQPGTMPSVVVSYALWQTHFGGDRSIVGKTIEINKSLFTVVGVAPPGFKGCSAGSRVDLWASLMNGGAEVRQRGNYWLNVFGRLKPGVSRRQAEEELNLQMQRIVAQFPDSHRGPNQITVYPLWRSPIGVNVFLYKSLPKLLALAAVLLLLACANVANLLLVRNVTRRREVALRLSLGATRWRLVRQLLVESLLLALAGGGLAMLLTSWTAGTLAAFIPPTTLPLTFNLTLNGYADQTVLLATLALAILTATIFGILPALRASSLAPVAVLKEEAGSISGGLHKSRLSSALVVAQIALSLLLLICAGLFTRSLQNAQRQDPGFDPNHVVVASYELGPAGYSEDQGIAFHRQVLAKLEALPGVDSVTVADFSPLSFTLHTAYVSPDGYVPQPHESMEVDQARVGPNYFRAMRIPLIAGRDFTGQDGPKSQPVAVVNQEFCERYWPGQEALGKRVHVATGQWFTVVGVARNGKYRRLVYTPEPIIFLPVFQDYRDLVFIHARVSGDPQAYAAAVQRTVHEINPDLPVFGVTTLNSSMRLGSFFERLAGILAGAFGLLALILAAVGIYGVIANTTSQRTHEIAIRMALGAQRASIFRLVLGQGLLLTLTGLAAGLAVSLGLTRYLSSEFFGVTSTDTLTYAAVTLLLCLVSLVACYIPARRATKVEPMEALRYE